MRNLTLDDVFTVSEIITEADVFEKLVPVIDRFAKKGTNIAGGAAIFSTISFIKGPAREHLYSWLADLMEVPVEDVRTKPHILISGIEKIKQDPFIEDFLKALQGSITSK